MFRKILTLFIVFMMTCLPMISSAETNTDELKSESEEFVEELGETSRSFTIPINIGPIYSVIIRKDGIGIAISLIKNKSMSLAMETVSFLNDLKEVVVQLENGKEYKIPAVVQLLNHEVGSFIVMNVSGEAAKKIIDIVFSGSPAMSFSFIQNDNNRKDMTVDEVNEALTKATGEATDVVKQAREAVIKFWENFSSEAGKYAENTYADISNTLIGAGDFLSNSANDIGKSISDTANAAGEYINGIMESAGVSIGEAMDSAGKSIGEAMDSAGESIGEAVENIGNFWNGLWGK